MKARVATTMVVLLGILCPLEVALASDLFYAGDIVVDSIDMRAEVDNEGIFHAVYLLTNRGCDSQEVDLQFARSSVSLQSDGEEVRNPVVFRPYERKSIQLTCNLNVTGETTKTLCLDPTMLFNGKPNSEPTKALLIDVLLPEETNGLVWANQEPDKEGLENGRRLYSWTGSDIYPTVLRLKWSTLQVDLGVEKSVTPREITTPDETINIQIALRNRGDTVVESVGLTDQYSALDFVAVTPLGEFGKHEPWLLWRKNINSLEPGETITLAYSVKYVGFGSQTCEFDLKPCVVTVDGNLVFVSNKVRMIQSADAVAPRTDSEVPPEPEAESLRFPSLPLLGGIAIVLAIVRGAYLIWKRTS
jgi:hypothetical protein